MPRSSIPRAINVETNADKIALDLKRWAMSLPRLAHSVVDEELTLALKLARQYSSLSDHSLADLARMGHPYATRHQAAREMGGLRSKGHPWRVMSPIAKAGLPHAAYLIHDQDGTFLRNWTKTVRRSPDGASGYIANATSYAAFLEGGTSKMIARPILTQVAAEVSSKHDAIYNRARRALRV